MNKEPTASDWTEEELKELEDPDMWDWDTVVARGPSPNPGAQVVVEMPSPDFRRIARCAEARVLPDADRIARAVRTLLGQEGS